MKYTVKVLNCVFAVDFDMSKIKRLVLDVLKPHEPSVVEFTHEISKLDSVSSINSTLIELDEKVKNLKLTIVGTDLHYGEIEKKIRKLGGSIHSIDEVVAGEEIIENVETPQDV